MNACGGESLAATRACKPEAGSKGAASASFLESEHELASAEH